MKVRDLLMELSLLPLDSDVKIKAFGPPFEGKWGETKQEIEITAIHTISENTKGEVVIEAV